MQVPAQLADGQVAGSAGDLYTAPASTATYLSTLTLFNTNTTSETIIVYLKPGATDRKIYRVVLAQNESAWLDLKGVILSTGDKIRAETTTAAKVDYTLSGIEEGV